MAHSSPICPELKATSEHALTFIVLPYIYYIYNASLSENYLLECLLLRFKQLKSIDSVKLR